MEYKCPICNNKSEVYTNIENIDYFNCRSCDFIFIDLEFISKIDNGNSVVEYTENYWNNELKSAKKRAYDDVVGRMTELIYYAKRPIQTMVDIGTGPGYILDFVDENMQNLSKILFLSLFMRIGKICQLDLTYSFSPRQAMSSIPLNPSL